MNTSTDLPIISDEEGTSDFDGQLIYENITYHVIGRSTKVFVHEEKDELSNGMGCEYEYDIWFEKIMNIEDFEQETGKEINDTDGEIERALELILQTQN